MADAIKIVCSLYRLSILDIKRIEIRSNYSDRCVTVVRTEREIFFDCFAYFNTQGVKLHSYKEQLTIQAFLNLRQLHV